MEFPLHIPFAEDLGLVLVHMHEGQAEVAFEPAARQLNSFGVAHGGALMSLLDVAMCHAARSTNGPPYNAGPGVVTLELKTSFMRPGQGRLRCLAKVLHRTATLAFCEAQVLNEAGALTAHASGTFKFLRAIPAGRHIEPVRHRADEA